MTDVFRTYYWVMLVNTICSFPLLTELQICSEWQSAHPQMKNHDLFQPVWKIHISKFPTSITTEEGHVICFWGKNGLMKNLLCGVQEIFTNLMKMSNMAVTIPSLFLPWMYM